MRTAIALLILGLFAIPAYAQEWGSRPNSHILDKAGVINPNDEKLLEAKVEALSKELNADIKVAFLSSRNKRRSKEIVDEIEIDWDMGKETGEGRFILLIAFVKEGMAQLRWGGAFADTPLPEKVPEIMEKMVAPRFQQRKFADAVSVGLKAIADAATAPKEQGKSPLWTILSFVLSGVIFSLLCWLLHIWKYR